MHALRFTAKDEYLVSGGVGGVQVWRVKDGERVATMKVKNVFSLTVSKDGRFIAAGSLWGDVWVWDASHATDHEQVFAGYIGLTTIYDVDFSPDSTRLVSANGNNNTATIWDVAARQKVRTLGHGGLISVAKYSPQGDRIVTATRESVRFWDSEDGRLLVDIGVPVDLLRGLLWFNNYLFVKVADNKIRQIEASSGTTVAELSVPPDSSFIAMPQHGQFIACAAGGNIALWDTSTHTQRGLIPLSSEGRSITFSPSEQLFAVAQERKIIIKHLAFIKVCLHMNKFPFLTYSSYIRSWTFVLTTLR